MPNSFLTTLNETRIMRIECKTEKKYNNNKQKNLYSLELISNLFIIPI